MKSFAKIRARAVSRYSEEEIANLSSANKPLSPEELAKIPDDRWLSAATKQIFCAGFNWKVIENKWDGFEAAFEGFDIGRWVMSNDDDLAALVSDKRIVRNGQKIATVPANARFFAERAKEHGSVGIWIGNWPVSDQIGLTDDLAKNGSRLGSMSGQYFLRFMGKDSYILSRDVIAALIDADVVDKTPTSKTAKQAVQAAFNDWAQESGLSMTAISWTLAKSIDG